MADNSNIIESFLVSLGFDVDASSLAVFNKAIESAALRVTALYGAVNAFTGSMVFAFSKISEGFEEMGYQYHILAPAINKAIVLRNELFKAYSAAGINIRKVILDSVHLNMSLAKTRFALEAIYKSVGSKFFGQLQKQSDMFRKRLYENMPYIINALEKLVKAVFEAFEWVTILGGRIWSILSHVYQFFKDLDEATGGWSTKIMLVIAAWKLLNLEFLATPLGALIAGLGALLLLFDDFKTYQEGGESLINWGPLIPLVDEAVAAFTSLWNVVKQIFIVLDSLGDVIQNLFTGTWRSSWDAVLGFFSKLNVLVNQTFDAMNRFVNLPFDIIGKLIRLHAAGVPLINTTTVPVGAQQPLGAGPGNSNTNVHANMQTQINIAGSPNADATARSTAAQQGGVNRDMVRNLKGAIGQ